MGTLAILEEYKNSFYVAVVLLLIGISSAGRIKRQDDESTSVSSIDERNVTDSVRPFLPKTCGVKPTIENRVVGGEPAIRGSWPWMVTIFLKYNDTTRLHCGGSLVTNQHVVTAGHCVYNKLIGADVDPDRLIIRLGAYNLTNSHECDAIEPDVEEIRKHESFNSVPLRNDIAVLKFKEPVPFTAKISPLCLPFGSMAEENIYHTPATVLGWGLTENYGQTSDVLREATMLIQTQQVCINAYADRLAINDTYLCAGLPDGSRDSCVFDSGGPLMTAGQDGNYYLIGIVSFGKKCGDPRHPGVYTRVTEYLEWLSTKLSY